jgi:hypothetical protein
VLDAQRLEDEQRSRDGDVTGRTAADSAVSAAYNLGFTGRNVYYFDMEAYPTGNASCKTAVNSFVNGWSDQLQNYWGEKAGVYGSGCGSAVDSAGTTRRTTASRSTSTTTAPMDSSFRTVTTRAAIPRATRNERPPSTPRACPRARFARRRLRR